MESGIKMTTIGLHGTVGSSKTWGATLFGYLYSEAGYQLWSDIELNPNYFPDYVNLDTDPEYNWDYLQRCAVTGTPFPRRNIYCLFDEWQYHSDSRMSKDMQNIVFSYLFIQSRKRGLVICMTSVMKGYLDKRDREAEDIAIKCYKKHKSDNSKCYDHECELPHYFEWIVLDINNRAGKTLTWWNPEPIFPMYQTLDLTAPVRIVDADAMKELVKVLDKGGKIG